MYVGESYIIEMGLKAFLHLFESGVCVVFVKLCIPSSVCFTKSTMYTCTQFMFKQFALKQIVQ